MPLRHVLCVIAVVCAFARGASGDTGSPLSGRVTDRKNGGPVEGAVVHIAGPRGEQRIVPTDRDGRYAVQLAPGTYTVTFAIGNSKTTEQVTVEAGQPRTLDGRIDSTPGEVIIIEETRPPPVLPEPRNWSPRKAPPYSDRAVLTNAWTKAWLLLDVSARGEVTRFKFLKRPGYDLEPIASAEAFKLRFDPARDAHGKPVRVWLVWAIEWPSAWWLQQMVGTRSAMPPIVGFPPRRLDASVPCAGSGPLQFGSHSPAYRDCSKPDLSKAAAEPWIVPER